ncbi:MAG TPA: aminotransferase class I/II-fold pyridoxal phosphate-dependent enzyme [Cellulomonas sp.]|uniref:MalY/PatB family protein n=1 Tax=Cellulomonas sp. TaxID=40001 RepID=UPI002E35DA7D|nr:aminotransferase class I/II-fold pyridoxal phosphate-dependent enzyme [Cellulomonas sp.]HEX5333610.1 aminotransferase class I/II-fold pyridoxal phosphate-dependent enzyme [Cellulomonas sp.]
MTGFDDITTEELRATGGLKWSAFPDKIGAFVAEMDFGIAPPITRALHAAVDVGAFGYLPPTVTRRMSLAYSEFARDRYRWDVPAEDVRPLADVIAGLEVAIRHFSTPGSAVIVPTPAYMPFLTVPGALGRDLIQVPMASEDGRYTYDLDALDAAFAAGGNLLVLCNPHNPVGRVLEPGELAAVAQVVERHGGRVFSDEIHAPLVHPGYRHTPYASVSSATAEHTLTATSASKAWNLPGLKCAQLILSNDHARELWSRIGPAVEHGAANLGVIANTVAYADGGPWLDDVLAYLDGNRRALSDLVRQQLPGVGYLPPEGTYLAWLDVRDLELGERPAQFFLERAGVATIDGRMCGDAGRGFIRYNFATPRPIMERTIEAMARALAAR